MGRPREFDETTVLDAATDLFWSRGFEAASTRELADKTGLTTASLYNAYGDKRALYRRVVERYAAGALEWCGQALSGPATGGEALRAFFAALADGCAAEEGRNGCLIVNAGLETAPHDPEFQAVVAEVFRRIEQLFRDCVDRGRADGSVTLARPAEELAALLLAAMLGLRVLARARPEPELTRAVSRAVAGLLEP